jgi:glutamate-ammonia-ligase adenylyltransferase
VLALLQKKGLLPAEAVAELGAAYDFLRRLEHRLQYLDDAQTHELPAVTEDQALIAAAMGFDDYAGFMTALDAHREQVSRHFDGVFASPVQDAHACAPLWMGELDADTAHERLSVLGFTDTGAALARLAGARASRRYLQLPEASRERFDALVPRVIELAAKAGAPDAALARALDLLDAISRRGAYLALLHEYPQALEKVASTGRIRRAAACHAPSPAARWLSTRARCGCAGLNGIRRRPARAASATRATPSG